MSRLRPFFPFFGAKWRAALRYPPPLHERIVEPFAGSAGYAVTYANRLVLLVEKDPIIAGIWRYLLRVRASEVRALPARVEHVDDVQACQEARHLIGFWLNRGQTHPGRQQSAWMRSGEHETSFWSESKRDRIASQLELIRHWFLLEGSWEMAPSVEATWFVDPPYAARCGRRYRHRSVDYAQLAPWCRARRGQTIVCESASANWLPFQPFAEIKTMGGKGRTGTAREAIWTNGG